MDINFKDIRTFIDSNKNSLELKQKLLLSLENRIINDTKNKIDITEVSELVDYIKTKIKWQQ